MRFVRILFSLIALAVGFVAAMFLLLLGLATRRFGRQPAPAEPAANSPSPSSDARPVARSFSRGEVIDI